MHIVVNTAMTLDGKIATVKGMSTMSTNSDLRRVHRLRSSVDAIIVGISTVIIDDPILTVRLVKGNNPTRVIVDSKGRIPIRSRILQSANSIKTIVAVTESASSDRIKKIRRTGATVITVSQSPQERIDMKQLLFTLKSMGLKKILVEGGGELNWSVLNTGMANRLIVTIAPIIVGGRDAPTLVEGEGFQEISEGIKMQLDKVVRDRSGEVRLYYSTKLMG